MNIFHYLNAAKKEKKKALLKKTRKNQELFQLLRLRRAEESRVKDMDAKLKPKKGGKKAEGEWSDKVSTIRNRLTGKKRDSKERWNRFAGTSDGGGRGL